MNPKREFARLPVVESLGPLPDARHFKYKDQVLVRFKSGWYTLGTIIKQKNPWNLGADELFYVYFRDVRHSNCRLLGGQGCDCPPKKGHVPGCKLANSGMRGSNGPRKPPTMAKGWGMLLPMSPPKVVKPRRVP